MPSNDLREKSNSLVLRPFAHFDVLAAMHFPGPEDEPLRQKFSDMLRIENGLKPRRFGASSAPEVTLAFNRSSPHASIVGYLFNALLEQTGSRSISMNKAIAAAQNQLPSVPSGGKADGYSPGQNYELHRRSARVLRDLYGRFKNVAHLWGALIHGQDIAIIRGDRDMAVLPNSLEKLPLFLAYAEAHLARYRELPIKKDQLAFIDNPWTFVIPEHLEEVVVIGPHTRS